MTEIALLIKSYARDHAYAVRLVDSIHRFNVEQLPVYLVVPAEDRSLFAPLEGRGLELMAEEDVCGSELLGEGAHGLSAGYLNQEIVKLSFWETGLAGNYFCVDSDATFIREFGAGDFMRRSGEPFSVLVQDKDLQIEPRYFREHWQGRERSIRQIMEYVGLDDPIVRTCHGHQVFSARVLESFKEEFLASRGWTYASAVTEVPYEFSWYNMWLQKSQVIPIHQIEPLVKVFHNENQHLESLLRGETVADIARAYVAIVVNSNYSRDLGAVDAGGDKRQLLGQYYSYGELMQVFGSKGAETLRRRLGR